MTLALAASAPAERHPPAKGGNVISVADGFFLCHYPSCTGGTIAHPRLKKRIEAGQHLVWAWSISNQELHNVTLRRHPRGVDPRKYTTRDLDYPEKVRMRFRAPGRYVFICTDHPKTMRLHLLVKR